MFVVFLRSVFMTFYERLEILCEANNEKPTTLCKAITKSPGNLDTWKKGNARLDHIKAICDRYNCSAIRIYKYIIKKGLPVKIAPIAYFVLSMPPNFLMKFSPATPFCL